jgi:diadenylate cyclase
MTDFLKFLSTIRWQDCVDIIINSYILFRVYVLFHGTNAFRVLVGITSLWILQEVAASIGLILTSWAVRGITTAAAVIIIVVFRNEIRSVLQVRNVKTFLWGSPIREQAAPVDIVVQTVYQMAKKRIGALLVFPAKEELGELVHGGIPWHGTVSQEMLLSIFWPNNPVHDGAIIIRGTHIVEVGVLLPLSQRQDLPSYYGTRHRAALGLAERSDALVIAVSEERGRVTAAKGNSITPFSEPDDLSQLIRQHLNISDGMPADAQKRERLRLSIAAVLSFLVMTGIWFGFTRSQDTITALSAPIEYVNRPIAFEILDTSTDEARVQLYGSSALIKSLRPGQVLVRVDLSKAVEGRNAFPITQDNVILPPGVFLNKVQPSTIDVHLDVPITKELPVQVDWTGKLPENLNLTKVTVVPETINVIGGSQILQHVSTIYTAPVRLDSLDKSGSVTTSLVLSPPSLKLVSNSSDKVVVNYALKEKADNDRR